MKITVGGPASFLLMADNSGRESGCAVRTRPRWPRLYRACFGLVGFSNKKTLSYVSDVIGLRAVATMSCRLLSLR
jgi:hypothetical protein